MRVCPLAIPAALLVLLFAGVAVWARGGLTGGGSRIGQISPPVPVSMVFSPTAPQIADNSLSGAQVATITVGMSDGSTFAGTLSFAPPTTCTLGTCFGNSSGMFAVATGSPNLLTLGRNLVSPGDDGAHSATVAATQNGTTFEATVPATVILSNPVFWSVAFNSSNSGPLVMFTAPAATGPWTRQNCTDNASPVRNPTVYSSNSGTATQIGGFYWIAHQNSSFANPNSTGFTLGQSTDMCNWTFVQTVNSNIGVANQGTWATSFFQGGDGNMHILVALGSTQGPYNLTLYEQHPTDPLHPEGAWSAPHAVAFSPSTPEPVPSIDGRVINDNGTWRLFFKDDTTFCVDEATSTSDPSTGTYTIIHSGDWAGWGCKKEEPYLRLVGSTWYMFFWNYLTVSPGENDFSTNTTLQ